MNNGEHKTRGTQEKEHIRTKEHSDMGHRSQDMGSWETQDSGAKEYGMRNTEVTNAGYTEQRDRGLATGNSARGFPVEWGMPQRGP